MVKNKLLAVITAGFLAFCLVSCVQTGQAVNGDGIAPQVSPTEALSKPTLEMSAQAATTVPNSVGTVTSGAQVAPQSSNSTLANSSTPQALPASGSQAPGKGGAEPYNPLPTHSGSGIEGRVLVGPTCPVVTAGSTQCSDKPYQANISILSQKGQLLNQVESDAEGFFVVSLAPGTYVLQPVLNSTYPHGAPITVSVEHDRIVQVVIYLDSGIR